MVRRRLRVLPWAAVVALCALAIPATASASGMAWVSSSAPVGTNKSCASPGFNSVQAALEAAPSGAKINVCGGTYEEQIQVTQPAKIVLASGSGTAKLVMPSTPSESTTSCDTAVPGGQTDEISVCTSGKVSIRGLTIEALAPIATCAGALNGINVGGGAELNASSDTIIGASTTLDADKGCQKGIAVLVGSHKAAVVGHALLKNDTISSYQKNGPTVVGVGSTMKVINTTVTGEGPSPWTAQNGVEVAFGGQGTVRGSTITGNECELAGICSSSDLENQADGVLFYQAAAKSGVIGSTISDNDLGVYYSSGSATEPSSSQVKIVSNQLTDNRYEGILLEEGKASIVSDTITGTGELGIAILQASFQASASESMANKSTIEGMSVAAVGVLTEGAGPAGTFTIKNSSISKNASEVSNSSPNFTVIRTNDS
jgi:Right handed beta helix region